MSGDPLQMAWLYIGRCPPKNAAAIQINRIAIDRWFTICEAMMEALTDAQRDNDEAMRRLRPRRA